MLASGSLLAKAPIVTVQAPEGAVIHHVSREQVGGGSAPTEATGQGQQGPVWGWPWSLGIPLGGTQCCNCHIPFLDPLFLLFLLTHAHKPGQQQGCTQKLSPNSGRSWGGHLTHDETGVAGWGCGAGAAAAGALGPHPTAQEAALELRAGAAPLCEGGGGLPGGGAAPGLAGRQPHATGPPLPLSRAWCLPLEVSPKKGLHAGAGGCLLGTETRSIRSWAGPGPFCAQEPSHSSAL